MESADRELIAMMMQSNAELKRLYEEHEDLENKLSRFEKRGFLTVDEEIELKKLKKMKLMGVDKMMHIVSRRRTEDEAGCAGVAG